MTTSVKCHRVNLIGLRSHSRRRLGTLQLLFLMSYLKQLSFFEDLKSRINDSVIVSAQKILASSCFEPRSIGDNFYEANTFTNCSCQPRQYTFGYMDCIVHRTPFLASRSKLNINKTQQYLLSFHFFWIMLFCCLSSLLSEMLDYLGIHFDLRFCLHF